MSLTTRRSLGLLGALMILVAACGTTATPSPTTAPASGAPTTTPATEAPTAAPSATPEVPDITATNYKPEAVGKTGGKLILAEWQTPATNIYYDNSATTVEAMGIAQWGLWSSTPDYKYYGQLATNVPTIYNGGVTLVGDGMDVKVDLRPGAQWSDGQPITCNDIEATRAFQMDPAQVGNVYGVDGFEDISSVDGGDGTSCVIHYSKVYESYLGIFAPLLPAHYLKTFAVADAPTKMYPAADVASWVVSGPYKPSKWTEGAQIEYKPNAKFWETIKKATPTFDDVVFKYYESSDAEIAGYQNGEVDIAMNLNHSDLPKLTAIDPAQVDAIDGTTYEQNSWNLASLTTKFGDAGAKALLEAIHYAYDKDAITSRVLGGTVQPTCNFVSPLAWFYADGIECYKHDVAKANQILDAAGFTKGADGTRELNGTKVELLACTSAARQYRIDSLTLLATQLQEVGIRLNVKPVPSQPDLFGGWTAVAADTPCNTTHGNFDVAEFAWVSSPDPNGSYLVYKSDQDPSIEPHQGANYTRVKNPDLDKILDGIKRTVDLVAIKELHRQFQELYVDPANAFPEIALYSWKTVILKSPKLHNVVNTATNATNTWNIEDLWME